MRSVQNICELPWAQQAGEVSVAVIVSAGAADSFPFRERGFIFMDEASPFLAKPELSSFPLRRRPPWTNRNARI